MTDKNAADDFAKWLINEARFLNNGVHLVEEFGNRLLALGVPLSRLRVAQRFANPLIAAWGTIWRADDTPTEEYVVPIEFLKTDVWIGSPFQYVTENRKSLRKRLRNLDRETDYHLYFELAEQGGTDFLAMPLEYGDGSVQGMSIVTEHPDGFSDEHLTLLESVRQPLAAVMEPIAARRSLASLLKTYLGSGPSSSVVSGAIHQGDVTRMQAAIMMTDMRNFTEKSTLWSDNELIQSLGTYFELIANAVHNNNGDILKFIGDGVLAVFPVSEEINDASQARNAINAAEEARKALQKFAEENETNPGLLFEFGTGIHIGEVIYGNIGSPDRLDFTVIGDAVNLASRIEGMTKETGNPILCSSAIAALAPEQTRAIGKSKIRGIDETVELFSIA